MKVKLQGIKLWSRWSFRILAGAELLLLVLFLAAGLLRHNERYTFDSEIFVQDDEGNVATEKIWLPDGIYKVHLSYACDSDMRHFCNVEAVSGESSRVYSSGEHLNQGLGRTDFDLWVRDGGAGLQVKVSFGGGSMELKGLELVQTSRDLSRNFFLVFAVMAVIHVLYLLLLWNQVYGIDRGKLLIWAGLVLTILISSIPLGNNYMYGGSDITYHLLRVDNIRDGFLSGQFPVRIDPTWLYGNGYASSVCYGELFLYFPAFLRLIGFTLQGSWMWFLFVLNASTCLISYYSFHKIFKSDRIGLFCSVFYTLSIYRIYKMYSWSAIGEVQAMVFLPLILYAVYAIYTGNTEEKRYGRKWIPLALGMTGIIQCHVLTCELVTGFMGLACILLWKKTFRKKTLLVFCKAVGAVCLLNMWFLVPFFDYLLHEDMVIGHVSARTIQEIGLYPAQLLFTFYHRGQSRDLINNGLRDVEAMGIGLAMVFGLTVFALIWMGSRKTYKPDCRIQAGKFAAVLAILAMVMSLQAFPWTVIQFWNRLTQMLVSSIQYPNRFLMIATLLLTMTAGSAAVWLREKNGSAATAYGVAGVITALVTVIFYMNSLTLHTSALTLYDAKGMGTGYLSGAEYLPYETDASQLTYHDPVAGEGVVVKNYSKNYLTIEMNCVNSSDLESYVDVALLHYKGYMAVSPDNDSKLTVTSGDNHCVRVMLPADFEGNVRILFREPWYWQAANILSLLSAVFLIVGAWLHSHKMIF